MQDQPAEVAKEYLSGPRRPFTPLYIIAGGMVVVTFVLGYFYQTSDDDSKMFFAVILSTYLVILLSGFFYVIISRPLNFYSPSEFPNPPTFDQFAEAHGRGPRRRTSSVALVEAFEVTAEEGSSDKEKDGGGDLTLPAGQPSNATEWDAVLVTEVLSPTMDGSRADEAFQHVQEDEPDPEKRFDTELWYRFARFSNGDAAGLKALQDATERQWENPRRTTAACLWLSIAYQTAGNFSLAEETLLHALQQVVDEEQRVAVISHLSNVIFRLGRPDESLDLLKAEIDATDGVAPI